MFPHILVSLSYPWKDHSWQLQDLCRGRALRVSRLEWTSPVPSAEPHSWKRQKKQPLPFDLTLSMPPPSTQLFLHVGPMTLGLIFSPGIRRSCRNSKGCVKNYTFHPQSSKILPHWSLLPIVKGVGNCCVLYYRQICIQGSYGCLSKCYITLLQTLQEVVQWMTTCFASICNGLVEVCLQKANMYWEEEGGIISRLQSSFTQFSIGSKSYREGNLHVLPLLTPLPPGGWASWKYKK